MSDLTDAQKRTLYLSGCYVIHVVPPVTTFAWSTADWIKWIDDYGHWRHHEKVYTLTS